MIRVFIKRSNKSFNYAGLDGPSIANYFSGEGVCFRSAMHVDASQGSSFGLVPRRRVWRKLSVDLIGAMR